MAYLSQHIRNIKRKTTIQPERLESGPIYEIRYRSKTATKTRYLVLAVNIYPYDADRKNKKLHCLDMDFLPIREFRYLIKENFGLQIIEIKNQKYIELATPGRTKQQQFYEKNIGNIIRQIPKLYKTLTLGNMRKIEICDYDYTKVLTKTDQRDLGLLSLMEQQDT
tara:strand:+ start:170 stop:667 length:498 start_codon:yes stop_codon:yes gene_type:complete